MTDEIKLLTPEDRQKLALHLGVTDRTAEMLVRMYNEPILTHAEIDRARLAKRPGNVILRLRTALVGSGVEVYAKHGVGYWIDNTGRANVLRLLSQAEARLVPGNPTPRSRVPGDT